MSILVRMTTLLLVPALALVLAGCGGVVGVSDGATAGATPPPPPGGPAAPTVSLLANNMTVATVASGGAATLTWSSTNATYCTASGPSAWAGAKATTGDQSTGVLTSDSTFGLSCTGPGGTSPPASATVTIAPATGPIDAVADFAARAGAPGVFFSENFNYPDLAAASSHATNPKFYGSSTGNPPNPSIISISTANVLSGKSLRIKYPPNSGTSGNSWLYTFDVNDGIQVPFAGVPHDNFYFQVIVWADQHWDWPFESPGGGASSPKIAIIDHHDSSSNPGEVVLTNDHTRGFVSSYIGFTPSNGSQLIDKSINTPARTPDFLSQPSIDTGVPANPVTMDDFRMRYGPIESDTPNIPFASVGAGSSLAAAGFPNAMSARAGKIWNRAAFTVVTFYVNGAGNHVKFWAAKYGDAPKLIGDTAVVIPGLNMGRGSIGYPGFQLTPFITGNGNAGGASQPTTFIDYVEIIASKNPINFPGGFALP
jgi:hypothetical protein